MAGYMLGRIVGLESCKEAASSLFTSAQDSLYRVLFAVLTFTAILWTSVFLYASFYYTYIPAIQHIRPVHLQYENCGRQGPGPCSFPSAEVTLTQRQQLLMHGQPYKVLVEVELPESQQNQDAGMFLICVGLLRTGENDRVPREDRLIEKSCRSAMLHYKSWIHRTILTFLYLPFLLAGSAEEKQVVGVELFSGFTENTNYPATSAFIEIQSQHVQVYGAYLKIHAHFTGLRYFMFYWPLLSASLGISVNFFFLSVIAFLSWYKFYLAKYRTVHVGYDANVAKQIEEDRKQETEQRIAKTKVTQETSTNDDINVKTGDQSSNPMTSEKEKLLEDVLRAKNKDDLEFDTNETLRKRTKKDLTEKDDFEDAETSPNVPIEQSSTSTSSDHGKSKEE